MFVYSGHGSGRREADLGQLDVERLPVVVEGRRLKDDSGSADQHCHSEDPEEEAIEHHRDVLPVLDHLGTKVGAMRLEGLGAIESLITYLLY